MKRWLVWGSVFVALVALLGAIALPANADTGFKPMRATLKVEINDKGIVRTETRTDVATGKVVREQSTVSPQSGNQVMGGICIISAEGEYMTNQRTAMVMSVFANVTCPTPEPGTLTVWLTQADPGTTDYTEISGTKRSKTCATPCSIARKDWTAPGGSSGKKVTVNAQWKSKLGSSSFVALNDRGIAYPDYLAPFGTVPFPDYGPWDRVSRGSTFRADCITKYRNHRWGTPAGPFDAHHIKPVSVGGPSTTDNCVLLLKDPDHNLYTAWWNGWHAPNMNLGEDDDSLDNP